MRHFRMTNENIKNLSTFKRQVGSILKDINKFNEADKKEAITYLKKCISSNKKVSNKPQQDTKTVIQIRNNSNSKETGNKQIIAKQTVNVPTARKIVRKRFKNVTTFVKRITFCCKVCNARKQSILNFLKHLNSHIRTPISCTKCRQNFNSRLAFDFHLSNVCGQTFTRKKSFKCTQCDREFNFKRHLLSHLEGHKRNNCKYCGMVFTNKKSITRHLHEKHSLVSNMSHIHKCSQCEKSYVQKKSLFAHLKQHVPEKHVCLDCGLIIDTLEEYQSHLDMHYKAKKWECPRCKLRFIRKQHLFIHLKKHDLYKCVTCNCSYSSKRQILQHKQQGHTINGLEPKMMCPYCPKVYYRSFTLQKHMLKHCDKSDMHCKHCNKSFTTQSQYYRHCLTTTHEKNCPDISELLCDTCGKKFAKKYLLDDHVYRSHTTKEMLSCSYCPYETTNRTNMKRHNSIHQPPEDYICDQCGKHFTNIFSLKEHVSYSHLQVKQFKCDLCDKSFKRKSELSRHKKIHSDERPFVCQLCGSSYKRNTHLKRHLQSAHKGVEKRASESSQQIDQLPLDISLPAAGVPEGAGQIQDSLFWSNKMDSYQMNPPEDYSCVNIQDVDQLMASYIQIQNKDAIINLNECNSEQLSIILNESCANNQR